MIVSIHQPHFFPWLGYLDRMCRCDLFVILDHVQFERQNYQNRVAIKASHGPQWLVVPVCQRSRSERIMDKGIYNQAAGKHSWCRCLQRTLEHAYSGAPFFQLCAPDVIHVLESGWEKLVDLNLASIELFRRAFAIRTPLLKSSSLDIKEHGAGAVLEICQAVGATAFLGGLGASRRYLDPEPFQRAGIRILWQEFSHPRYVQHPHPERFAEGVSGLDLLFNCGPEAADVLRGG